MSKLRKVFLIDSVFVASYAHISNLEVVGSSKEAVDLFIMNHVRAEDVVITQELD